MSSIVYKAPQKYDHRASWRPLIFLAGSIEMGTATDWQTVLSRHLEPFDVDILNPRHDDWDSSWQQSITDPKFREQVEWELDGLSAANMIAMWFEPTTKAPITLLEFGLWSGSGKLIVGCPHGFWRRGNLEVVAAREGIRLHETWAEFVDAVTDYALAEMTAARDGACSALPSERQGNDNTP